MVSTIFQTILTSFRKYSFSERDKGDKFERLMQAYLQTDPKYAFQFSNVWLWNDFPARKDFGGKDIGIDLVAKTVNGDYWAIQCKCYQESAIIDKPAVDSFISTSGKKFADDNFQSVGFNHRLWISTTNHWGPNAEETIRNQHPPVSRINLTILEEAPVDWAKLEKGLHGEASRAPKKSLYHHQTTALEAAYVYFKNADRGKLIMACGTGKTFTSLKIAENETNGKGLILFLVPSIALLGQTLSEWTAQANEPIKAICICSDSGVTKKRKTNEDSDGFSVVDLALPASTNVKDIVRQFKFDKNDRLSGMTVVFSTYQSINVIAEAQTQLIKEDPDQKNPYGIFDLIICDEAHRTTGVTLAEDDSSSFVKVHDNEFLRAKKRIYMTATPRLYNDDSKSKAAQAEAVLCSMDDPSIYGEEIYRIGFGEAVERDLLSDYKVLILTVSENDMPVAIQKMVADSTSEINSDDASKLIGCINALSKQILGDAGIIKSTDPEPMRRAVAFCQNIAVSKKIAASFNETRDVYCEGLSVAAQQKTVSVFADHIDGTMSAPSRDEKLSWLKAPNYEANECRVLTNVRCLSEGVDVPSLDAVLFLSARNSQVDVVQSVGRVMRKAPGKKYGYIIIPVVVPANIEADKALDDNERYKVVWTVLNALRAHDDRFNATVNKIELNKYRPVQILVGRPGSDCDDNEYSGSGEPEGSYAKSSAASRQFAIQFEELQNMVFARMVQKVGDRRYWEQWAQNVAEIAERQVARINRLILVDEVHKKAFGEFLSGLQSNINPSITQQEAVEMLSQHIITKPVFEALFEGYSFVKNNPISMSMQKMLDVLEEEIIEKDTEVLQKFYDSVKTRAGGIDNAEGKQRIIIELYDKFFKTAFPKMVEKLGIVYTPVEVVDFIIHSVNEVLKKEFDRSLSDENVHILDPFTGTGTFITRLLQSGLIEQKDLERKYRNEIHANEIVLLAYYIAAVNIENAYHDLLPHNGGIEGGYIPFEGICLTDTFQLGETDKNDHLFSELFPQNSKRVEAQKKASLRVIIGNPPYSVGQKSANDNAQNQKYEKLDIRIANTYASETDATLKNSLYDSYIKAFRWSSDRLDPINGGIIAFVSNGAWLDGNSADGFRKCLEKEFSSIYVFNLRGNCRTQGELRRKEAGNVFGLGSRTPIAITLLVKNPKQLKARATIDYYDIGDYLSKEEKLAIVKKLGLFSDPEMTLTTLKPNEHGDWINKRDNAFGQFIPIGDKDDNKNNSFFLPQYGRGLATSRDAWCYNSSKEEVFENIMNSISFYNSQVASYLTALKNKSDTNVDDFIVNDSTKFSWDRAQKFDLIKFKTYSFDHDSIYLSTYRPFYKQWSYFNRQLNNCVYKLPSLFPTSGTKNLLICVSGVGDTKGLSVLIANNIPDLHFIGDTQCFPLYYYEERPKSAPTLFDDANESEYIRRDGISDFIFEQAKKIYGKVVVKEDIFYYVYGILHCPEYRIRFANDLKKMLPRIPLVDEPREFWAFSKAGRKLADLHLNYETVPPYEGVTVDGAELLSFLDSEPVASKLYHVEKMRFPKKDQKDTIIYNSKISIQNIPAEAYEYIVNGKSAIEWIMERYQITTHKESGIKNDPNDWATEVGNPRYILDLLLSIINVSVQTVEIVKGLPEIKFE
jgi:predicted helicase